MSRITFCKKPEFLSCYILMAVGGRLMIQRLAASIVYVLFPVLLSFINSKDKAEM